VVKLLKYTWGGGGSLLGIGPWKTTLLGLSAGKVWSPEASLYASLAVSFGGWRPWWA
jgi:hypothetical protein